MAGAADIDGGQNPTMNEHLFLGAGLGTLIGAILALTGAGGGILAVP